MEEKGLKFMKYIIASDIHGSAYYAELLVKKFEQSGAEKLILLGDLLYHGPRNDLPKDYAPKRVIFVSTLCTQLAHYCPNLYLNLHR